MVGIYDQFEMSAIYTPMYTYRYGLYLMYYTAVLALPHFLCLLSISQLCTSFPHTFPQYLPSF